MLMIKPVREFSADELETGRHLFRKPADFVKGVVAVSGLPADGRPEIAFAGRSNVGKSSLFNALVGRKALARTSNTPGRTRELNFFDLDQRLYLVDMPGYGYAKVSRSEVQGWNVLIRNYLRGRVELLRVFLLIDSRHGLKNNDLEIMKLMDEAAISYALVLTKTDKLKKTQVAGVVEKVQAASTRHPAAYPFVFPTSSVKGTGIDALRAEIAGML